ncbi:tetratricopeptide repeat protein 23-like [Pogona vitticeps]
MDEAGNDCQEKEVKSTLFATPAAKLAEAQKKAEKFAKEKEAHNTCRELIQCTALTRIIYGNEHWRLSQALANLAHSYLTLRGLPVQAMHHANSAKYTIFMGRGASATPSEERGEILSTLVTIYYTLGVANVMQKNSKESYLNLQTAERIMEELKRTDWISTPKLKVSERDLSVAFGRANLQNKKLELAVKHFEKAINATVSAEGEIAPELINLYQEVAQIEQAKKNYHKSIGHLLQAHSISLNLYSKFSMEAASTALLLGKAYASTGEEKHIEVAELYFSESLAAYKEVLGMDHSQTMKALKEFCKWLAHTGKRKKAYDLLKESFKSQQDPCSDFNKQAAERLYIMGCICLAEEKLKEAYQLLSECVQIQSTIYGPHHGKTKKIQELLDVLEVVPAVHKETRCTKRKQGAELNCTIPDL